ncbi:HAD family hydrolase [Rossellomorea oryzaecorticis]|uniref:HAD family hydrolase n=1 Tax=Rossellomorea oryzaecorticis TaxID=1396505 RepID=A0ABU9K5Y4_9BACI
MLHEKYKVLLFDLDDTLFNHSYCYKKAVTDTVKFHDCLNHLDEEVFFKTFAKNNQQLWKEFQCKRITFQELTLKRLISTLNQLYINISLEETESINEFYHGNYLKNIVPDPQIQKLLKRLKGIFKMGIVTNGTSFNAYKKVQRLGLNDVFGDEYIIVSEETGYSKPEPQIFYHVLEKFKINPEETLFVGDNYYTDICGASSIGMDTIWVNHFDLKPPTDTIPTYTVKSIFAIVERLRIKI